VAASSRILILDEPRRDVDVGAKAEIRGVIRDLAVRGNAVLLIPASFRRAALDALRRRRVSSLQNL